MGEVILHLLHWGFLAPHQALSAWQVSGLRSSFESFRAKAAGVPLTWRGKFARSHGELVAKLGPEPRPPRSLCESERSDGPALRLQARILHDTANKG